MTSQHVKNKSSGVTVVLYMHASYAETPPMFFRVGFQICTNLMKYWWGGGGGGGGLVEPILHRTATAEK